MIEGSIKGTFDAAQSQVSSPRYAMLTKMKNPKRTKKLLVYLDQNFYWRDSKARPEVEGAAGNHGHL